MMTEPIVGTLHIEHSVDPNGSLSLDVPINVPPAKLSPEISVSYHSAVAEMSVLGVGWDLRAFGFIERVGATVAQDCFSGSVKYDSNDRYTLNGQRLISISDKEYRLEIDQWSKVVAFGSPANPDCWIEHRRDGTVWKYGSTNDSNLKAVNHTATRIWALAETYDPFSNYVSYSYTPADGSGSLTIDTISYGGNRNLQILHQRKVTFLYQCRDDVRTEFVGGSPVTLKKRLASISSCFEDALVRKYTFDYGDSSPITHLSRLKQITLSDADTFVLPLKFDWSDSAAAVFDPIVSMNALKVDGSDFAILPMSVAGSGRTDLVMASKQFDIDTGKYFLNLDAYLTDEKGNIPSKPQPSRLTNLSYPNQLLALDANGDGKTDLLHISQSIVGNKHKHTLTILLSESHKYVPQKPFSFEPPAPDGKYYTADFEGNGYVGLAYVYKTTIGGSSTVGVQQLKSDGYSFKICDPVKTSGVVKFDELQVVIADPDGKGADGIFVLSPTLIDSSWVWRMDFFEPNGKGLLQYTDRFHKVGEKIPKSKNPAFLALPEQDGKTGLLLVSQDFKGQLQYQTLRSTGKSLADSGLKPTKFQYQGNINVGYTASLTSLNLVNIVNNSIDGKTEISVLRLSNDELVDVGKVTQPTSIHNYDANFVDLRGVGRTDCLFSLPEKTGSNRLLLSKFSVANSVTQPDPLVLGNTTAPPDYIVGYTNGLGAKMSAIYASLANSTVYTTADKVSGPANPYVNALARVASSRVIMDLSKGSVQSKVMGTARTQLVRFPKYVVQQLTTCALPSTRPDVVSKNTYSYKNARISFDGRGWLGFETITVKSDVLRTAKIDTYTQEFPFVGVVHTTEIQDISGPTPVTLQTTASKWESHQTGHGTQCYTTIASIDQTSYEKGNYSYSVHLAYEYDHFANLTKADISTPGKPHLIITQTYDNTTSSDKWIIGNQCSQSISSDGSLMSQTHLKYLEGTQSVTQTAKWVSLNSPPAVEDLSYDAAGNVTKSVGPWQAQQTFVYDRTLSFPVSLTTSVDDRSSLTASASYDYGLGEMISTTEYNGFITERQYDVLGRVVKVSEGESLNSMTVMDRREYKHLNKDFVCVRSTLCDLAPGSQSWHTETQYLDGIERIWKTAVPNPSDPSDTIYKQILFDGSGRTVREYQPYTSKTSDPLYASFSYDSLSRPTTAIYPPVAPDLGSVTINYDYSSNDGKMTVTRTTSEGHQKGITKAITVLEYFPNNETGTDELMMPLAVSSIDELGQETTTTFDAFRRALRVVDPSGVCMSQQWDGISRLARRIISNPQKMNISDFSLSYDNAGTKTITNNRTEPKVEIVYVQDRLGRLTRITGGDIATTYTYDDPNVRAQGRLSSITSATGVSEAFTYDSRGCKKTSSLTIDDKTFITSFEYTAGRALSRVTNPDQSVLTNTYFDKTNVLKQVELQDSHSDKSVSATFSHFDNGFLLPQVCGLGNGLTSTVDLAHNGVPLKAVLSRNCETLLHQTWTLNSSSRLKSYNPSASEDTRRVFEYNPGGQLVRSQPSNVSSLEQGLEYKYDKSGNISLKDGFTFVNDGWQLSSIKDSSENVISSFEYTPDGHLDKKKDGSGAVVRAMKYDSLGRMIAINSTNFLYDSAGHMVKADRGDSVTYYPSAMYEVTVRDSTETRTAYLLHQGRSASISTDVASGVLGEPSVQYYHVDHLGSVIAVSDTDGKIVTTYSYDDYGVAAVGTRSNIESRYKYSGKEEFEGLYYFGARFYDPAIGRFTTLDDINLPLEGITPSMLNQYAFSRNDPVNFIDVNGNSPWWHWAYHLALDALLIAVGIGLFFVPGAQIGAETFLGAGISGLQYDVEAALTGKDLNDQDWGTSMVIGGALSFFLAGASAMMFAAKTGTGAGRFAFLKSAAKFVAKKPANAIKWIGKQIGKFHYGHFGSSYNLAKGAVERGVFMKYFAKPMLFSLVLNIGGSMALQMGENLVEGKSIGKGLGNAALSGTIKGLVGGGVKGYSKYLKSYRTLENTGYIGPHKFYEHPDLPNGPDIPMSGGIGAHSLMEAPSGFFL